MNNKKADILHETVIFVVLNLLFFGIIIGFIYLQSSPLYLEEQQVSKQIALIIDSSKPGTEIDFYLGDFFERTEGGGIKKERRIIIDNADNKVIVRGDEDSSYDYDFFNDVNVQYSIEGDYLKLVIK